jgi:hypothetical protein
MRYAFLLSFSIIFLYSCKKKDVDSKLSPTNPITLTDSAFTISEVIQKDINEFDLICQINPQSGEKFTDVQLQWSTTPDFTQEKDSLTLAGSVSAKMLKTAHLTSLKQSVKYYARLKVTYNNQKFFSSSKIWLTGSLIITSTPQMTFSSDIVFISTNLELLLPDIVTDTRINLGTYECSLLSDEGHIISFIVPAIIPSGKYSLQLIRKGLTVEATDSIEVFAGGWKSFISPVLPINPDGHPSGLHNFGTCYSSQKGWIVGGYLYNGTGPDVKENMTSGYVYEFDLQQEQWVKKTTKNNFYVGRPISYYYNNSIYVIGGWGNNLRWRSSYVGGQS